MRVTFKVFDSKLASREKLFKAAIEFANKIEKDRLLTITHSEDRDNIVLTIWYWTDEPDKSSEIKAKVAADVAKRMNTPPEGVPHLVPPEVQSSDVGVTPVHTTARTQELPIKAPPKEPDRGSPIDPLKFDE